MRVVNVQRHEAIVDAMHFDERVVRLAQDAGPVILVGRVDVDRHETNPRGAFFVVRTKNTGPALAATS